MSKNETGKRVFQARGEKTQQQVATAMAEFGWPWTQTTVYKIESGIRGLQLAEAADLAAICSTTLEFLAGTEGRTSMATELQAAKHSLALIREALGVTE